MIIAKVRKAQARTRGRTVVEIANREEWIHGDRSARFSAARSSPQNSNPTAPAMMSAVLLDKRELSSREGATKRTYSDIIIIEIAIRSAAFLILDCSSVIRAFAAIRRSA